MDSLTIINNKSSAVIWTDFSFLYFYQVFQCLLCINCGHFWRILYFCRNSEALQKVIHSALYSNLSRINWRFKFMEMAAFKIVGLTKNYPRLLKRSHSKIKIKQKSLKLEDFSAHCLRWENVIFWGYTAWS